MKPTAPEQLSGQLFPKYEQACCLQDWGEWEVNIHTRKQSKVYEQDSTEVLTSTCHRLRKEFQLKG